MPKTRVWKNDTDGKLYHDMCFDTDESKEGFSPVRLDDLLDDDACAACEGSFLVGVLESGREFDEDDDTDEDDC